MSTNVSFAGVSIKIPKEKQNEESIKAIALILNYNEDLPLDEIYYDPKLKQWQLYEDYDNEIGLIYLTQNEYDVFDIVNYASLEYLNEILGELHPDIREHFISKEAADVKSFAIIYYNGSENPFKF